MDFPQRKHSDLDSSKKHLLYAISNILGKLCTVRTYRNEELTGLAAAVSPEGVVLHQQDPAQVVNIPLAAVISIDARSLTMLHQHQQFKTDQKIAGKHHSSSRPLIKWEGGKGDEVELDSAPHENWDQFEANRKKFGIQAEFDEEQYTTKLVNPADLTPAQVQRAEKLAAELSKNTYEVENQEDEEKAFGAVLGTGRYQKQRRRADSTVSWFDNDSKSFYKHARMQLQQGRNIGGVEGRNIDALNLMVSSYDVDEHAMHAYANFRMSKEQPKAEGLRRQERPLQSVVAAYFTGWKHVQPDNNFCTWFDSFP